MYKTERHSLAGTIFGSRGRAAAGDLMLATEEAGDGERAAVQFVLALALALAMCMTITIRGAAARAGRGGCIGDGGHLVTWIVVPVCREDGRVESGGGKRNATQMRATRDFLCARRARHSYGHSSSDNLNLRQRSLN